jgi:hypothetical protein
MISLLHAIMTACRFSKKENDRQMPDHPTII